MAAGGLMFVAMPFLKTEFARYPGVYRDHDGQMSHFPVGMAAILLSMVVLALLYARMVRAGGGWVDGAAFGALIGLFVIGAFVLHNFANLNIGWRLTAIS